MPRKPIIRSNEHYYHLTARSNNKEDFYLPTDEMWRIFVFHLRNVQLRFDLNIAAFVLMDNHFHLLLKSPNENIDRIMYFLMKYLGNHIRKKTGRINKIFGNRYKGCLIKDEAYLFNVYKYIYRNPVKAGICSSVENYPYSSWQHTRIVMDTLFFPERKTIAELKWLNCDFQKTQSTGIQRSLRRTLFESSQDWEVEPMELFI